LGLLPEPHAATSMTMTTTNAMSLADRCTSVSPRVGYGCPRAP
jgi:hypothetical protein